jgi:hypothetical protein
MSFVFIDIPGLFRQLMFLGVFLRRLKEHFVLVCKACQSFCQLTDS